MDVGEEVVAHLGRAGLEDLLNLTDETPDGKVVVVHLEVVVVLHRLAELLQILRTERLSAQRLVVFVHAKGHVVGRAGHAVALENLAQILDLARGAVLRLAKGQVVVLVRLRCGGMGDGERETTGR